MEIRYILPSDEIYEVSNVYEQSWRYAYKGIIPQSYLDSIPVGQWVEHLRQEGRHTLVAVEHNRIIGTSSFSKSRFSKFEDYGEIISIYFLPEYTGKEYGRLLLNRAAEELKNLGYDCIFLWVLEDNHKARHFYEKNGFVLSGEEKLANIGGKDLKEIMYVHQAR